MLDLTVIICTCNRRHRLRATLQHLERVRQPPGLRWEVLVVDNHSGDGTTAALAEFAAASALPLRCLTEPRQGKSWALNRGLAAAQGELIAFLDDDTLPDREWLLACWQELQADTALGVVAVRVELANPQDLPLMVITARERKLVQSWGDVDGHFGGCCVLRRQVADAAGPLDTDFGPGARFPAGEDLEYNYRIWKAGYKMLYTPAAVLYHDHGRRTPADRAALLAGYNLGRGAFYAKHLLAGDRFAARLLFWTLRSRLRALWRGAAWRETCLSSLWLLWGFVVYAARAGRRRLWPVRRRGAADSEEEQAVGAQQL